MQSPGSPSCPGQLGCKHFPLGISCGLYQAMPDPRATPSRTPGTLLPLSTHTLGRSSPKPHKAGSVGRKTGPERHSSDRNPGVLGLSLPLKEKKRRLWKERAMRLFRSEGLRLPLLSPSAPLPAVRIWVWAPRVIRRPGEQMEAFRGSAKVEGPDSPSYAAPPSFRNWI